jgi:hypothetical protein
LGEHGFHKRHPPPTLDLAAEIQDFFCVFWPPENACPFQTEVDDAPDATLDHPTADRETFGAKCLVLHTGFMGLKVLDRRANHLVGVMALVQCLERSDNRMDISLFQERAHPLIPELLLRLRKPYFGWGHQFPGGMSPVHNFYDTARQCQISLQRRDTIPNPTRAVSYDD